MESLSNQVDVGSYTSGTVDVEEQRRTRDPNTTILDCQNRFVQPVRDLDVYESGISYIEGGHVPFHGVLEGISYKVEYYLFLYHVSAIKHARADD
jgi:hypothetical protein